MIALAILIIIVNDLAIWTIIPLGMTKSIPGTL